MTTRTPGAFGHVGSRRLAGASACCVALLAPAIARAQLIAVKTAPVAESPQFAILPSANLGLAGVSIALPDSALDPFVNPAKGAWLRGTRVFGSPTYYSVSREAGGGLTIPLGVASSSGAWFGAFALAMQEVNRAGIDERNFPNEPDLLGAGVQGASIQGEPSRQNRYVLATLGRRLPEQRLAVAASVSWWGLHVVDGVELYYPRSSGVRQRGEAVDVRLGVLKEWRGGATLEAMALHNRFGVNQDVTLSELFWDPAQRTIVAIPRVDPNADRTDTWGVHLGYTRPLADSVWRVGAILTGNRITQPRLPGYDLPQVPADAGRAYAYDVGGGVSRSDGRWTAGVDAIYEPVWSRTWVRTDVATETRAGAPVAAGEKTLESRFRFDNAILRAGLGRTFALDEQLSLTLQGGGQLKAYRYRLDQWDALQQAARGSNEGWEEWTRSWGVGIHLSRLELRYRGRLTTGAGRPGVDDLGIVVFTPFDAVPIGPGGFFGPPPLPFGQVRVTTHQISLSIPIR